LSCGSLKTIFYGKTSCGYQRFKCKTCNRAFTFHNRKNKIHRERRWFELWIVEGYSVRQLTQISRRGIWKIKQVKNYWLSRTPKTIAPDFKSVKHILFDGTYFKHENCLMVVMDSVANKVIGQNYHLRENYLTAFNLFKELANKGVSPMSITIDGNTSVIRAIKAVWPEIAMQRCLTHIQRQGLSWLRKFPKIQASKDLRRLLVCLTDVKTHKDKEIFINNFRVWEKKYGRYILSLPPSEKVHSDLRRTRNLIIRALPDMFHYLDNRNIPATTNKIEGYFSRLKSIYRQHRGLSKSKRKNYFDWYIFFKNIN